MKLTPSQFAVRRALYEVTSALVQLYAVHNADPELIDATRVALVKLLRAHTLPPPTVRGGRHG